MDADDQLGYQPPPEFQVYAKDPLVELNLTDSTELWLIQWPVNQTPDFDGQEVTLKLHHDGHLGSFTGSSGKSYDVVSFASQEPDAAVFLSSKSDSKCVGKISRRVSLVHYPEPHELQQKHNGKNPKFFYRRSSGTTSMMTANTSYNPNTNSTHSSRYKSSLSELGEPSSARKRSRNTTDTPTRSLNQSTQDSDRGHSAVTSTGSLENSKERKSKKSRKIEI